jgi:hypothetical protein
MNNKISRTLLLLTVSIKGCSVIDEVFKEGKVVRVFIAVAVLAIILFIISKFFKKNNDIILQKKTPAILPAGVFNSIKTIILNTSWLLIPELFHRPDNHQKSCNYQ